MTAWAAAAIDSMNGVLPSGLSSHFSGSVLPQKLIVLSLASRVDVRLAVSGSHTDGSVLQGSTESTHRVSFEVRQVDHKIVIGDVRADYVVLDPFVIFIIVLKVYLSLGLADPNHKINIFY